MEMIMWGGIMALVMAAVVAGFAYLDSRLLKVKWLSDCLDKLCGGKKWLKRLAGLIIIALCMTIVAIIWTVMNAFVVLLHLMVAWMICDLVGVILKKVCKKEFEVYWQSGVALVLTVAYLSWGWYCAHNVWETTYAVDAAGKAGGLKIVQITDSHIGAIFDGDGFSKHIDTINTVGADVVLITGDFVDDGTSCEDMVKSCAALSKLQTKYGVYFVFGNHDKGYYASKRGYNADVLVAELEKNGVVVLEDEAVEIADDYVIIGRQDFSTANRASMEELTSKVDMSKFVIVMDHQPHDYKNQAAAGVDLVLSGHTHGGQFIPIIKVGEWIGVNDRTYGYEKRQNTNFIVSSGIADWDIKFKTGCISEYVVVDIK